MRWGHKAPWPELAENMEMIVMLNAERAQNYAAADLGRQLPEGGVMRHRPTAARTRRLRHKEGSRRQHSHLADPERPGRIQRCLRCRPLRPLADAVAARPELSRRWARS